MTLLDLFWGLSFAVGFAVAALVDLLRALAS